MEQYILDTNLFFNMEANLGMGNTTETIIRAMTTTADKLKTAEKAVFFMPPRIVDELLSFFDNPEQPFLKEFLANITIKSPNLNSQTVSAQVFAQFIDECRTRAYRGMNAAEEEMQKVGQTFMGKESLERKEFQITIGAMVKNFRERYRTATRVGFIDSLADFELIMLAKELNGTLVSTDEGVLRWGRLFGVTEMPAPVLGKKLQEMTQVAA